MKAISKKIYVNVLDDIVNKYNNTVHKAIKMKPIDVTSYSYAEYNEDSNKRNSKFKVGNHVRMSMYKIFFAKGYAPNWSEQTFVIKKLKTLYHVYTLLMILMVKKLFEVFMKKNCRIKKNLEQRKYLKEKVINCMLNGKDMTIHLIVELVKKTLHK